MTEGGGRGDGWPGRGSGGLQVCTCCCRCGWCCCWSRILVLAGLLNGCGVGGLLGVSGGKSGEEKGTKKGGEGGVGWMVVCGAGVATGWQTGGWAANTVGGGS